jgi:hypothetical protein
MQSASQQPFGSNTSQLHNFPLTRALISQTYSTPSRNFKMAQKFKYFPLLPAEIRLQIWRDSFPPEVVEICALVKTPDSGNRRIPSPPSDEEEESDIEKLWVKESRQEFIITSSPPRTPLHAICHESRQYAQENNIQFLPTSIHISKPQSTKLDRDAVINAMKPRPLKELWDPKTNILLFQHAGFLFGSYAPYKTSELWAQENSTYFMKRGVTQLQPFGGYQPAKHLFFSLPSIITHLGPSLVSQIRTIAMEMEDWSECIRKAWIHTSLPWIFAFTSLEEVILTTEKVEIVTRGREIVEAMERELKELWPEWKVPRFTVRGDLGMHATERNLHCFPRETPRELLGSMMELFYGEE